MLNKVILVGNLGGDPEIRRLENGASVAKFTLATNESYKDKDGNWQKLTEWHTIIAWRALAEQAEKWFKKGRLVYIEGKLTHRKWQDKDGVDRYTTEVVANVMRSLEKSEGSGGSGYMDNFPTASDEFLAAPARSSAAATPPPPAENGTVASAKTHISSPVDDSLPDEPSDDLPF